MNYQDNQKRVINEIEKQCNDQKLAFSTVDPVDDFVNDSRICLTSVHFPDKSLISQIKKITNLLKSIEANHFYYPDLSLHLTIKNIKVIHDPPTFTPKDIEKAIPVFDKVMLSHHQFKVFFYRLLLFPHSLALIGTTEPELDAIHLDLDRELEKSGVPDNKKYINKKYFFANMTLVRFYRPISQKYINMVMEISQNIKIEDYNIDSVSLITANASLMKLKIIKTWKLK